MEATAAPVPAPPDLGKSGMVEVARLLPAMQRTLQKMLEQNAESLDFHETLSGAIKMHTTAVNSMAQNYNVMSGQIHTQTAYIKRLYEVIHISLI